MRRRRLLLNEKDDEPSAENLPQSLGEAPVGRRLYGEDVQGALAATLADLPPQRWIGLAAILVLGLSFAWGVVALGESDLATPNTVRLQARPTLQSWFSTLAYAGSAPLCALILHIRKRRIDDFRARYRIWALAGFGCLLASLHAHVDLVDAAAQFASSCGLAFPRAVWLGGAAFFYVAFLAVVAWEARECRGAVAWLALAGGCRLFAASAAWPFAVEAPYLSAAAIAAAAALTGDVLTVFALVYYSRFVVRQAAGLMSVPAARPKRNRAERTKISKSEGRRVKRGAKTDIEAPSIPIEAPVAEPTAQTSAKQTSADKETSASETVPHRASSRAAAARASDSSQREVSLDDRDPGDFRGLSKAQRRALRKQKKRGMREENSEYGRAA